MTYDIKYSISWHPYSVVNYLGITQELEEVGGVTPAEVVDALATKNALLPEATPLKSEWIQKQKKKLLMLLLEEFHDI